MTIDPRLRGLKNFPALYGTMDEEEIEMLENDHIYKKMLINEAERTEYFRHAFLSSIEYWKKEGVTFIFEYENACSVDYMTYTHSTDLPIYTIVVMLYKNQITFICWDNSIYSYSMDRIWFKNITMVNNKIEFYMKNIIYEDVIWKQKQKEQRELNEKIRRLNVEKIIGHKVIWS